MILYSIAFLLGTCSLLILPDTSLANWLYLATTILALILALNLTTNKTKVILKFSFVFFLGSSYALYQANLQLANSLPNAMQKQFVTAIGSVASLPKLEKEKSLCKWKNPDKVKFNFLIEKIIQPKNSNIKPGLVHLNWQTTKKVKLGDKWQLTMSLKRPRGFATPGSFDVEKYYFSQRIIALGYVIDKYPKRKPKALRVYINKKLKNGHYCLIYNFGQQIRQYLNDNIIKSLKGKEFLGIILAVVTGSQYKITEVQWEVLRETGTEHLVAIAGLHIGFISGLAFLFAGIVWRIMPIRWLKTPAQVIGAIAAILTSFSYAYLAGFSVSTKRACLMIIMAMLGLIFRRIVLVGDIFSLALVIILLIDPFSVLTMSFWLSFTAVGILLYALTGRKTNNKFDKFIKPNLVLSIGLLPLLLAYFNAVPLISPVANFIAIPWVSFSVVPFALLGAVVYPIYQRCGESLWNFANASLQHLWPILVKLQQLSCANWRPSIPSLWYLVLAFIGILWILAPYGFPGRIFGICGFLPLLFPSGSSINKGDLNFTLLDVGQGLSLVIETKNHVLVYDTGPKFSDNFDAGEAVVWPFLRERNIKKVDKVVVSHADLDHSGGLASLLNHIKTKEILTPIPKILSVKSGIPCLAEQHWEWDAVYFEMLHPTLPLAGDKNDQSCVLHIKSGLNSILLTGDIGFVTEKKLVLNYPVLLKSSIIVVPHHGSHNSSSLDFVRMVNAKYALVSAGYLNQYRHPSYITVKNYKKNGAKFLNTAMNGAISFKIMGKTEQLSFKCYRIEHRNIWNID
jgi:competence protein ComEC